jgi:hypothetical protein
VADLDGIPPAGDQEEISSMSWALWVALACAALGVVIGEVLMKRPLHAFPTAGAALRWVAIVGGARWASFTLQRHSQDRQPKGQPAAGTLRHALSREALNSQPDSHSTFVFFILALAAFAGILHAAWGPLE